MNNSESIDHYVLIPAGGIGKRTGLSQPKQFVEIAGKPILVHTMECFLKADSKVNFVVVCATEYCDYIQSYFKDQTIVFALPGRERFHSVKNGLEKIPNGSLVGVHDAVRPFVTTELILDGLKLASREGNAISTTQVTDSLRKLEDGAYKALDRVDYFKVQTPQYFKSDLIKKAYNQKYNKHFTDDASVVEHLGESIQSFKGDPANFKITSKQDIQVAKFLLG